MKLPRFIFETERGKGLDEGKLDFHMKLRVYFAESLFEPVVDFIIITQLMTKLFL